MGAILKNAIAKLGDDDIFCVGSRSSYFFIGNKAEWERDKDEIESWCNASTKNAEVAAKETWEKRVYDGLPDIRDKYSDYAKWYNETRQAILQLGMAQKKLDESKKAVKNYRPVLNRAVIHEYVRDIPGEGISTVFLVGGVEVGEYWLREEYATKKVNSEDIFEECY